MSTFTFSSSRSFTDADYIRWRVGIFVSNQTKIIQKGPTKAATKMRFESPVEITCVGQKISNETAEYEMKIRCECVFVSGVISEL